MRKQRAFASLTEAENQQIAEWLRHETYEVVLERLRKPRPDGFGLDISKRPLETLYAKTNRVERINNRIASGQRLTLAEFDAIQTGENADVAEQIHDAIMDETHAMATSGENTPTQLLALQRLADFPARAEYRAQRAELDLRKEERDQEKHAHKVQMDLQKSAHKIQMDLVKAAQKKEMEEHRKRMNEERLALSQKAYELRKRSLDLREQQIAAGTAEKSAIRAPTASSPQSAMSDDLGPLASTLDEIEARATRKFNLPPPDRSNRADEALEKAGTAEFQLKDTTTPAPEPTRPAASVSSPSAVSTSFQCEMKNAQFSMLNETLEQRVSQYTLARHYEAAHGKNPLIVGKYAAWNFKSKMQWCPCGNQSLPCPEHGEFPKYFWEMSPDNADYTAVLRAKKLPFIPHYQLLREQEEQQQQAAAQPNPLSSSLPPLPLSETLSETLSNSSDPINTRVQSTLSQVIQVEPNDLNNQQRTMNRYENPSAHS